MESSIAEKFQAMVKRGILNSRMKDFYDIWLLSHKFDFKGTILAEAIEKTFKNRSTPIASNLSVFEASFQRDEDKQIQWVGFIRKTKIIGAPDSFDEAARAIKLFLEPVISTLADEHTFTGKWKASGPWRS
jgi:hypothetical protein